MDWQGQHLSELSGQSRLSGMSRIRSIPEREPKEKARIVILHDYHPPRAELFRNFTQPFAESFTHIFTILQAV
jgi:hypothetical protein